MGWRDRAVPVGDEAAPKKSWRDRAVPVDSSDDEQVQVNSPGGAGIVTDRASANRMVAHNPEASIGEVPAAIAEFEKKSKAEKMAKDYAESDAWKQADEANSRYKFKGNAAESAGVSALDMASGGVLPQAMGVHDALKAVTGGGSKPIRMPWDDTSSLKGLANSSMGFVQDLEDKKDELANRAGAALLHPIDSLSKGKEVYNSAVPMYREAMAKKLRDRPMSSTAGMVAGALPSLLAGGGAVGKSALTAASQGFNRTEKMSQGDFSPESLAETGLSTTLGGLFGAAGATNPIATAAATAGMSNASDADLASALFGVGAGGVGSLFNYGKNLRNQVREEQLPAIENKLVGEDHGFAAGANKSAEGSFADFLKSVGQLDDSANAGVKQVQEAAHSLNDNVDRGVGNVQEVAQALNKNATQGVGEVQNAAKKTDRLLGWRQKKAVRDSDQALAADHEAAAKMNEAGDPVLNDSRQALERFANTNEFPPSQIIERKAQQGKAFADNQSKSAKTALEELLGEGQKNIDADNLSDKYTAEAFVNSEAKHGRMTPSGETVTPEQRALSVMGNEELKPLYADLRLLNGLDEPLPATAQAALKHLTPDIRNRVIDMASRYTGGKGKRFNELVEQFARGQADPNLVQTEYVAGPDGTQSEVSVQPKGREATVVMAPSREALRAAETTPVDPATRADRAFKEALIKKHGLDEVWLQNAALGDQEGAMSPSDASRVIDAFGMERPETTFGKQLTESGMKRAAAREAGTGVESLRGAENKQARAAQEAADESVWPPKGLEHFPTHEPDVSSYPGAKPLKNVKEGLMPDISPNNNYEPSRKDLYSQFTNADVGPMDGYDPARSDFYGQFAQHDVPMGKYDPSRPDFHGQFTEHDVGPMGGYDPKDPTLFSQFANRTPDMAAAPSAADWANRVEAGMPKAENPYRAFTSALRGKDKAGVIQSLAAVADKPEFRLWLANKLSKYNGDTAGQALRQADNAAGQLTSGLTADDKNLDPAVLEALKRIRAAR